MVQFRPLTAILSVWAMLFILCAPAAMAQTYSNTDAGAINGTISCAGTARLTRTFSVPNIGTVTDVDFGFLANHSWRGDIGATLSHNGVSVDMFNLQIGGAGNVDNYNVLLDDSAAELINTGANNVAHSVTVAPFQFDARPNNALSAFNGIDASGDWTLEICDGFPGADNGNFLRADLILTATPPAPPVLACALPILTLDWDTNPWPNGSLTESFTVGNDTVSYTISGDTGAITADPQGSGPLPVTSDYTTGGLIPAEQSLQLRTDFTTAGQTLTMTIDLGTPGFGVQAMQFSAFDIDFTAGGFQDEIEITGSLSGSPVTPALTPGPSNSVAGNVATGQVATPNTSGDANVLFTFQSPVDQVTLIYRNGPAAPANSNAQAMGFHDLAICPRPVPELVAEKTAEIWDPGSEGLYAVPGNDIIYSIAVTNQGDGSADANSLFLVDAMPGEISFFNGDIDDAGPESDPVILIAQNGAGVSLTYPADVGFASGSVKPTDFSQCTYAPTAGYDSNVNFVCLNPKGSFAAGDPDPQIEIKFRAKIN